MASDDIDFGFKRVARGEKAGLVRAVFDGVASRYDLMNDLMSGGVHRLWKDEFVAEAMPRRSSTILDVAGGTGDVAERLLARAGPGARVLLCDVNHAMVAAGRDRAVDRGEIAGGVLRLVGDAECLPLPNRSVDLVTIAFGLRNVTDRMAALADMRRVLRPGGRFACLEFSHVENTGLARLYDAYSFTVLPRMGALVAGDRGAYEYLVESIRQFPKQAELAAMMGAVGLEKPRWRNLMGGVAAIHTGWRL